MANQQRPQFIRLKIDVTKIDKRHFFHGKKKKVVIDGREVEKGAIYLDCTVYPNRDGEDQYGNTHFIGQDVSKEARERKERGPIIGNAKVPGGAPQAARAASRPTSAAPASDESGSEDDRVPF